MPIAKNVDCDAAWSSASARPDLGGRRDRLGARHQRRVDAPRRPAAAATDETPTAFRFDANERASETATSDPMLESGDPITSIVPPRPASTPLA